MTVRDKKLSVALGTMVALFGLAQTEIATAGIQKAGASLASALAGTSLAQIQGAENSNAEGAGSEAAPRSPEQILAESQATLDRMEAAADNIGRQLRQAREEKDVVRILCLDDKLNQMNVAARSAADRVTSIEAAVTSGNAERAQHDDAVLGALSERADELVTEANQCIGAETGVLGKTKLQLIVDPTIPKTDTAAPPISSVVSTPPVAASPTF